MPPTFDDDPVRTEEFLASIREGRLVEPHDWMPDEYRYRNLRFIEMHANSEIMGALPEREWIARAPTLKRKRSLAAKVQDEVGHGHLIYRVAESLGKPRRQMYDDLVNGRTSFHNVFHYPTFTWADVACIGFLVDGAAIVTQKALLNTSYGPYVRVMKRVVAEESLHYRHGEDVMLALAGGTDEQFEMLQEGVNRWWEPIMHFFGNDIPAEDDPGVHWGIKSTSNEENRQQWMSTYVPKLWDMGVETPDPNLRWDEDDGRWHYTEPDWDRLMEIVKGDGTEATKRRLFARKAIWDHHTWLHDVITGDAPEGVGEAIAELDARERVTAGAVMARFEVFGRRKQGDDLTHVGQVHAHDIDAAMVLVRETHFRHEEGMEFALVPSDCIHLVPDASILEHEIDMSYRQNHGFGPFGPKREKAREKAEARGRGELRRRPVPGRAGGVASKD